MKVSKLIQELQKFPQNKDVKVDDDVVGILDMEIVSVDDIYGNVIIKVKREE